MPSIHEAATMQELTNRINSLQPDTQRLWGKMDVAQMLAHCVVGVEAAMSNEPVKRNIASYLFGELAKKSIWSEKPFRKSLPTAPNFVITDSRVLEKEKQNLLQALARFTKEPASAFTERTHPFFGKMAARDWDMLMYRHIDHHLKQFGA